MNLFNLHKDLTDHPDKELIPIVVWEKYQHIPDELKKREKILARDTYTAYQYTQVTGKSFPLGEPAIAKNSYFSRHYACSILNGPFKLGEPAIATDAIDSFAYAVHVLKGPFKLSEPAMAKHANLKGHYELFLRGLAK